MTAAPATIPYQPGSGTEGDWFYAAWCARCVHDQDYREDTAKGVGCDILTRAWFLDTQDDGYPAEWVRDADGAWPCNPRCTAFHHVELGEPSTVHDSRQGALL